MARVPIEVNPSKLGGAIPDEATLDGCNLAVLAAKRNKTQDELIRGLILAWQHAYRTPHHKTKSKVEGSICDKHHATGIRLSLSKMEHTKTTTCNSLQRSILASY
jgi:hypothetical protein